LVFLQVVFHGIFHPLFFSVGDCSWTRKISNSWQPIRGSFPTGIWARVCGWKSWRQEAICETQVEIDDIRQVYK
jgi:hypothetical protein